MKYYAGSLVLIPIFLIACNRNTSDSGIDNAYIQAEGTQILTNITAPTDTLVKFHGVVSGGKLTWPDSTRTISALARSDPRRASVR